MCLFFFYYCSNAAEAKTREDYFHTRSARCSGGTVCQNSVSGYFHARRGGPENQPPRVTCAGESLHVKAQETRSTQVEKPNSTIFKVN